MVDDGISSYLQHLLRRQVADGEVVDVVVPVDTARDLVLLLRWAADRNEVLAGSLDLFATIDEQVMAGVAAGGPGPLTLRLGPYTLMGVVGVVRWASRLHHHAVLDDPLRFLRFLGSVRTAFADEPAALALIDMGTDPSA